MTPVGVDEAKARLSELIERVAAGEDIVILSSGQPVARLVPIEIPRQRQVGVDIGRFEVPENFNEPLPASVLAEFE